MDSSGLQGSTLEPIDKKFWSDCSHVGINLNRDHGTQLRGGIAFDPLTLDFPLQNPRQSLDEQIAVEAHHVEKGHHPSGIIFPRRSLSCKRLFWNNFRYNGHISFSEVG